MKKPKQDNGLLQEIRENYEEGWSSDIDNRIAMESDLRFNAGEQWADDVRLERQTDNRPIITENRLPQFVRQVSNDMRANPPAIKVLPTSGGATKATADIMTGMVRNIEADGNTRRPYIVAGTSAARCSIGHFRILTEYVSPKSFDQKAIMRPIDNPFAVTWDPTSTAVTREDADWCFVVEELKEDTFARQYPGAQPISFDNKDAEGWSARWLNASKNTIKVAEYWRKRYEPDTLCKYFDGQRAFSIFKSDKELIKKAEMLGLECIEERDTERVVVECIKTNGHEILEEAQEWPTPHIPIVPVVGEEYSVGENRVRHSVIRFAKDSQVLHNYWLSTQVEHLALQPKAPYVATAKQVEKYQTIWKNANVKNYSVLVYDADKDAPGPPKREMPPQSSQAFTEQIMRAGDGMKATTGVYDAALGAQGNETSGKAIQARDRQGDVSTFEFRDNLNASVEYAGKILVALIPKIYDTERMERILGEDGSEDFAEINKKTGQVDELGRPIIENDLSLGEYDAQVSSGPSYTTRRQEASESMLQFVQTNPQAAQVVMDLVAKNMDWPGADEFAERLQKLLPPNLMPETDDPEEQQQRQIAAKQAEAAAQKQERAENAEIAETEAKAAKTQAEAVQTQLETAMQSGQIQEMIGQIVQMQVQQIMSQMMAPQVPMNGNYPPQ